MSELPTTTLGRTGLEVTQLGYGAMELRGASGRPGAVDATDAGRVLNAVLDAGINFIDTSPDYGRSEELIGEHLAARRDEFFLASKCGCLVDPPPREPGQMVPPHVFTPENIRAGVEQSLRRMRTDHLDLVQFHISPSRETLEEHGAVEALQELRDEGKTRFIGMSGTLPNLTDHIAMGVFDAFQIPYSALEPEHENSIADACDAGAGTIIRGGVARGAPEKPADAFTQYPERMREALERRRDRWAEAQLDEVLDGMSRMEFMLRYTLTHPQMHTTIVGTANPDHLAANVAAAAKGPLPRDQYEAARRRLGALDR